MGIETVAVYSEADKEMPFVKAASKAVCIGEAPVNKSYLQADKILEVALNEKVDGIHPGYGFLSENAEFAESALKAGVAFIGPNPGTIKLMGDKIISRRSLSEHFDGFFISRELRLERILIINGKQSFLRFDIQHFRNGRGHILIRCRNRYTDHGIIIHNTGHILGLILIVHGVRENRVFILHIPEGTK
jgi:hypothetical protein